MDNTWIYNFVHRDTNLPFHIGSHSSQFLTAASQIVNTFTSHGSINSHRCVNLNTTKLHSNTVAINFLFRTAMFTKYVKLRCWRKTVSANDSLNMYYKHNYMNNSKREQGILIYSFSNNRHLAVANCSISNITGRFALSLYQTQCRIQSDFAVFNFVNYYLDNLYSSNNTQ
jgi:DNA repair protein RadC